VLKSFSDRKKLLCRSEDRDNFWRPVPLLCFKWWGRPASMFACLINGVLEMQLTAFAPGCPSGGSRPAVSWLDQWSLDSHE
jgi:hypothetical protein